MSFNQIELVLPFILYLFVLIGISIYTFKYTTTMEGFVLGGRKLHPWVAGLSVAFSGCSGWMFMGAAGLAYTMGPSVFYLLLSYLVAVLVVYLVVPLRLRNYSGLLGAITYPQFFVNRVRDNTNLIRIVASVSVIAFMSAYVAAQYSAAVKSLVALFGFTPLGALLITAVVVTLYCLVGGFQAVCITDYIQGWVILIGSVICSVLLVVKAGGFGSMLVKLGEIDPNLLSANMGKTGAALLGFAFYYLATSINAFGRPHDTIRFFAIESSKDVREMAMVGHLGLLLIYWTSFMIGYAGRVFFPNLADPETIFPMILGELMNPWFAGIMLTALMALIMSTVDSQLLSAASTLSEDFYRGMINKKTSEKKVVWIARISVVMISAIGAFISYRSPQSVMWLTIYAGSGLAATFGPSLILALYWKRLTKWGVIASMLTGIVTVVVWYNTPFRTIVNEGPVGWVAALIVGIVVSLMTEAPNQDEIEEEFKLIIQEFGSEQEQDALVMNIKGKI